MYDFLLNLFARSWQGFYVRSKLRVMDKQLIYKKCMSCCFEGKVVLTPSCILNHVMIKIIQSQRCSPRLQFQGWSLNFPNRSPILGGESNRLGDHRLTQTKTTFFDRQQLFKPLAYWFTPNSRQYILRCESKPKCWEKKCNCVLFLLRPLLNNWNNWKQQLTFVKTFFL